MSSQTNPQPTQPSSTAPSPADGKSVPNRNGTALVVMDFENWILKRIVPPEQLSPLIGRVNNLISAARSASSKVAYVRVSERAGYTTVSSDNKVFSSIAKAGAIVEGSKDVELHPELLQPQPDEPLIDKRRFSAVFRTDLLTVLRAQHVHHVVLCGVSSSGCVLSTQCDLADRDFKVTVVRDGCYDADAEVHRVLMEKILPKQASVIPAEEAVKLFVPSVDQSKA